MLRQAARLDPVPWRDALRELCQRTASGQPVCWWLTGSAALAARGAQIEPADLDVVCGTADASAIGDLFADVLVEPVLPAGADEISEWRGRAFCGALIEWIGGVRACVDEPRLTDFGPVAAGSWRRWPLKTGRSGCRRWTCSVRSACTGAARTGWPRSTRWPPRRLDSPVPSLIGVLHGDCVAGIIYR